MNPSLNQAGLYDGQTDTKFKTLSVGTAFQQIAVQNNRRLLGYFINVSANNIYLLPTPNVSIGNGILLIPQGGNFKTDQWHDYDFTKFPFYAIASAINSPLLFIETNIVNL